MPISGAIFYSVNYLCTAIWTVFNNLLCARFAPHNVLCLITCYVLELLCLERVELSTFASVVQRSIQLSYKH